MDTKRIIVLCGNGVASSAMAASKLENLCSDRGLKVVIEKKAYRDMKGAGLKPDLIVSLAPGMESGGFGIGYANVPVIMGVSFLTGMGYEKVMDDIEKILRQE
jgi:PTS system galactitol-specific IIB component